MRSVCSLVTLADGSTHKGVSHVTTPMDITKIVKPASKPVVAKCAGLLCFASSCLARRWEWLSQDERVRCCLCIQASGVWGNLSHSSRVLIRCCQGCSESWALTWCMCRQGGRPHLGPDAPSDGGLQGGVLQLRRTGGQRGAGLLLRTDVPIATGNCRTVLRFVRQRI